jgi:hypothetical protein
MTISQKDREYIDAIERQKKELEDHRLTIHTLELDKHVLVMNEWSTHWTLRFQRCAIFAMFLMLIYFFY